MLDFLYYALLQSCLDCVRDDNQTVCCELNFPLGQIFKIRNVSMFRLNVKSRYVINATKIVQAIHGW